MATTYDLEKLDLSIREAINGCTAIPTKHILSSLVKCSERMITHRLKENSELQETREGAAIRYLNSLSLDQLKAETFKRGGGLFVQLEGFPKSKIRAYERIDGEIILPAIKNFNGIPSPSALARSIGACTKDFIMDRFDANPFLKGEAEKMGLNYVNLLSIDQLKEEFKSKEQVDKRTSLSLSCILLPIVSIRLNERIDTEVILPAIVSFTGIPTTDAVTKHLECENHKITNRFEKNPLLRQKAEEVGLKYVNSLTVKELEIQTSKLNGLTRLCNNMPTVQVRLYERIDAEILLPAIRGFDGIPSPTALSRVVSYGKHFISDRFNANTSLVDEAVRVALNYINSLSVDQLISGTVKRNGLTNEVNSFQKVRFRFYERIDNEIILPAISSSVSSTTLGQICNSLPFHGEFIRDRIKENPVLFKALAEKQGLTLDQAVELALGRGDESIAAESIMNTRLKNLYAFREMLGIFRIFSDLFEKAKRILEVSLYPAPLGKAIELDGTQAITGYANPRRDLEALISPEAAYELVILQGIHRVSQEDFNKMLLELRKTLPLGTSVIATYSEEYGMHESMPGALRNVGYELKDSGILEVQPPDALGDRDIREKIPGQSNVLHLVVAGQADAGNVPNVIKLSELSTETRSCAPGKQTDLPDYALKGIQSVFVPSIGFVNLPGQPLLVTITDDNGKQLAVVGFDMNNKRPGKMELGKYPDSKGIDFDFRSFAKQLIRDANLRANLGITPGAESKIKLNRVRNCY